MKTLYITGCIPDGSDPNHALDVVCGPGWAFSLKMAVEMHQAGLVEYMALLPHKRGSVKVEVRKTVRGLHYLRTHADAVTYNNLENLVVITPDNRPYVSTLLGQRQNALGLLSTVLED
jgi:Protein of unknown function (DUF3892)